MHCTVITGVSQGLGAAIFDQVDAAGHRVVALGRRFTDSQHARQRAAPDRVVLRPTDLADAASLPSVEELTALVGPATRVALVHNAALIEPLGAVGGLPADQIVTAVAVNLTAPMLLTNSLLGIAGPPADRWQVTVVFISSGAAHRVAGGRSVYSATKRGGETFFEGVQVQGRERLRVVSVDPGIMDTSMQAVIRGHARAGTYLPGRERYVQLHERGELPSPADVARRIATEYLHTTDGN